MNDMNEQTFPAPNNDIQAPRSKSPLPWLGVLVLVLIVGVAGGYWLAGGGGMSPLLQNNKLPPPVIYSDEQVDEMNNWKTYRNEEYGFEFMYPGDVKYDPAGGVV